MFSSVCRLSQGSSPGPQFYRGVTAAVPADSTRRRSAADRCSKQTLMFCRTGWQCCWRCSTGLQFCLLFSRVDTSVLHLVLILIPLLLLLVLRLLCLGFYSWVFYPALICPPNTLLRLLLPLIILWYIVFFCRYVLFYPTISASNTSSLLPFLFSFFRRSYWLFW